jgi:hypothetical protein
LAVELGVAYCDAARGTVTGNEHLATDERDLAVVCCSC